MKKLKIIKRIIALLTLLVLLTMIVYSMFNFVLGKKETKEPKLESTIDKFNYKLDEDATKLYKDEFYILKDFVEQKEIDYNEYAKSTAKLYIIDLYTLDNKMSKDDVGGIQFLHPNVVNNFTLKATDTIYKYVKNNADGKRNQKLPIVKSITVDTINNVDYKYGDKEDKTAYEIKLTWDYVEDLVYDKAAVITIVREGEQLYIVEEKNVEESE